MLNATRREFIITLVSAAAWPSAAQAQRSGQERRIGVLMPFADNDAEGQARVAVFRRQLGDLGWFEGQNLRIDYRWAADPTHARLQVYASELVGQKPDAIFVSSTAPAVALMHATRTIPIVFAQVIDPVRQGFVTSLARPGSNITGFTNFEAAIPGKWLELVKDLAPLTRWVLVLYDPETTPHGQFVQSLETAAPALGLRVTAAGVHDASEIERSFEYLTPRSDAALIVHPAVVTGTHRQLIVELAARNRMPAVYPFRYFVAMGGLISYGINPLEPFRQAASYIDRILKGEKPANLPVQQPTKFELVVNLKTAKTLAITVPPSLLARADEVIE
jgi:putative ABC transport system substrate-binding protein